MTTPEMLAIAVALSMDALAIAIAIGCAIKRPLLDYALRIATGFGASQLFMPIIGWLGGCKIQAFIAPFDHWVVFGVLSIIGGKMIYESRSSSNTDRSYSHMSMRMLLLLSLATSLDALSVGFSLSLLNVAILKPALVIGVTTFTLSLAGVFVGCRAGHYCKGRIETLGGLTLIVIGTRILWQHLYL